MKQTLAEAVAATSAGDDQGHCRRRDRTVFVAHQSLQDPSLATPDPYLGGSRDPLLVCAAKKNADERSTIEQTRGKQASDKIPLTLVVCSHRAARQSCSDLVADIANEAM